MPINRTVLDYLLRQQPEIEPPVTEVETPLVEGMEQAGQFPMPEQRIPPIAGTPLGAAAELQGSPEEYPDVDPFPQPPPQETPSIGAPPSEAPGGKLRALAESIRGRRAQRGQRPETSLEDQTRRALILNAIMRTGAGIGEAIGGGTGYEQDPRYNRLATMIQEPLKRQQAMSEQERLAALKQKAAKEVKAKEKRKLSDSSEFKMVQGKLIPDEINKIKEWMEVPSAISGQKWTEVMGPIKGRAKKFAGQIFDWSTAAAEWEGRLKPVQQMYGRFMEGGVLRKEDEIKYEKQFPQITDKPEIAKFKLDVVNGLVERYYNTLLKTFIDQGYNMTGFEKAQALKKLDKEIIIMVDKEGEKFRVPVDKVAEAEKKYGLRKSTESFSAGVSKEALRGEQPAQAKTVVKKFYSKKANKTKIVYSDGTTEVKSGRH